MFVLEIFFFSGMRGSLQTGPTEHVRTQTCSPMKMCWRDDFGAGEMNIWIVCISGWKFPWGVSGVLDSNFELVINHAMYECRFSSLWSNLVTAVGMACAHNMRQTLIQTG